MDKNTNNWKEFTLGNPQEEQPRRIAKRRKNTHRRILLLVLAVTVAVAAVAVALMWDRSSFDGLRRSVIYARAEKDENGCALLYAYDSDASGCFTVLEGSLISVSQSHLQVINEKGQKILEENIRFTQPALADNGTYAALYDVGGTEVYLISDKGLVWQKEISGEILAVTINERGQVTVTANTSGYKAGVCVYGADGEPVFAFNSSQRFCMTACASDDGRYLGVITMGREESGYSNYLVTYRMNGDEPLATTALGSTFIYDLLWQDSHFCAIGEGALLFVKPDGEITAQYDFSNDYLHRCASGGGYVALETSHYRSGSQCALSVVDSGGVCLASGELEGEVLSMSAAGRYIAVLYSDSLVIFDKNMERVAGLNDISEARQVVMRRDGSAVLVGNSKARLYLP